MTILGLDIGGANIKAATADGWSQSLYFPLWQHPEQLAATIKTCVSAAPEFAQVAMTMTGELADCFPTKAAGVAQITRSVVAAVAQCPVDVWTTRGHFVPAANVADWVPVISAANWHALASWIALRWPPAAGLLIDIGSTTTDIIPFRHQRVTSLGQTDRQRLVSRELVYTGVRRTPLCAIANLATATGQPLAVAAEWFATTEDVYLWLGNLPEDPTNRQTADSQPATRAAAGLRLRRMLCADATELTDAGVTELAQRFSIAQQQQIAAAVDCVTKRLNGPLDWVVTAGSGEFLANAVMSGRLNLPPSHHISLSDLLSPDLSTAACAYAVAQLRTSIAHSP